MAACLLELQERFCCGCWCCPVPMIREPVLQVYISNYLLVGTHHISNYLLAATHHSSNYLLAGTRRSSNYLLAGTFCKCGWLYKIKINPYFLGCGGLPSLDSISDGIEVRLSSCTSSMSVVRPAGPGEVLRAAQKDSSYLVSLEGRVSRSAWAGERYQSWTGTGKLIGFCSTQ